MKHCFIDAETLGQNMMDCAVIDVSAIVVDTEKMKSNDPYDLTSIGLAERFKLSVVDQVSNYGFEVYQDTVDFWESQSDNARKHVAPKKTDLTVKQFCNKFLTYLDKHGKIDYWWSRSNSFDPVIMWRLFDAAQKKEQFNGKLPYWAIRDTRTFIDAKLDFPKVNAFIPLDNEQLWNDTFVKHDSSWDVLADVLRIQRIIRIENDLEG